MLRIASQKESDPVPKYSPAEQKIVDQYTKMGYDVSKDDSGKMQFKKVRNVPLPQSPIAQSQNNVSPNTTMPGRIPLPDYANPESRMQYAKAFRDKYGSKYLEGYGDIPLRVNDKPAYGSDTSKNLAIKAAKAAGVDPALLYSSSMIEGESGLFPGFRPGVSSVGVRYTGDKNYPVSGLWHFGLDSFEDYLPTLKKKGYVPQDFDQNFKILNDTSPAGPQYGKEGVMFKNTESGVQAKAAMMRAYYDELDDYASKKNIKLTPEQRDFFGLAHFNSGAHGYELMDAYNKAGLLKGNDFIKKMPDVPIQGFIDFYRKNGKTSEQAAESAKKLHAQIYGNVLPRILAAKGLKDEGYFDDYYNQQNTPAAAQKVLLKVTK